MRGFSQSQLLDFDRVPYYISWLMTEPVIRIDNLEKKFGSIVALDGVALEVEAGKIFGLIGANGAGKTTTVKILMTLVPPDRGLVEVCGIDVTKDPERVRAVA